MPGATGGSNISSSNQINTGVVTADDIATDAVEAAEIKADAVGASEIATDAVDSAEIKADAVGASEIATDAVGSAEIAADAVTDSEIATDSVGALEIKSDAITNTEIKSDAAIADTKLAQITTASKVHGTAITGLASLPAGAGVIPAANIPGPSFKIGAMTYDMSTASGNQNVAHGLGKTPLVVKLTAMFGAGSSYSERMAQSFGAYDGTNNNCIYEYEDGGGNHVAAADTTYALYIHQPGAWGNYVTATITVTSTNIVFAWTKGSAAAGSLRILWEVIG